MMSGIGKRVAVGAGWMVLMRFADRVVGLVSTVILARLLLPEDFGLVAMAMALIAVLDMMGEMSVETVLIQNQSADRSHYDTAWTINIIKGVVLAGILAILGAPAARFFAEPRVEPVIYGLAVAVALTGFENIAVVDFRKHLEFHREFAYLTTSRVVATAVTIALAVVWPGPWALVGGTLARRVVAVTLSFYVHRYRPRLSLSRFGELFRFSRWVMLENLLSGLRSRLHSIVLGRVVGAQALGYYIMAYEIAMLASSEIEQPIRRAVYPGYAKLASDPTVLRKAFLDVFGAIAVLGAPLALGVGMVAPLLVPLVLGPNWLETIPLIQILSLFGLISTLGSGSRLIYLALNKPHVATALSAVDAALMIPFTLAGALTAGATGVAWGMVGAITLTRFAAMTFVVRVLGIPAHAIAGRLWRVVLSLTVMALAVGTVQSYWQSADSLVETAMSLAVCVLVGAAIYAGALFTLWWISGRPQGAEHYVLEVGRAALQRLTNGRWPRLTTDAISVTRRGDGA